jgi:hypothetical protein
LNRYKKSTNLICTAQIPAIVHQVIFKWCPFEEVKGDLNDLLIYALKTGHLNIVHGHDNAQTLPDIDRQIRVHADHPHLDAEHAPVPVGPKMGWRQAAFGEQFHDTRQHARLGLRRDGKTRSG